MANQKEIWRDIKGYEGLYQVSNLGRVKSLNYHKTKQKRILQPRPNGRGYYKVAFSKCGNIKSSPIHRLVAIAFIPNPDNKPQVNHKNGIKTDNRVENLEWVTNAENVQHAIRTKLFKKNKKGENHPRAKLTNEQADKIREEYIKGDRNYGANALAQKYGVNPSVIYATIYNKSYKDI